LHIGAESPLGGTVAVGRRRRAANHAKVIDAADTAA
jgi:hypothetical protein